MKLYHFHNPHDYRYARAGRLGTWSASKGVCLECRRSTQERIPPLILEWLPDSDQIGDFVWPAIDDEVVVAQHVRDALRSSFVGFQFEVVEMYQDPKLRPPRRVSGRTKPRVWLPYAGPTLWDLRPTGWCDLRPPL